MVKNKKMLGIIIICIGSLLIGCSTGDSSNYVESSSKDYYENETETVEEVDEIEDVEKNEIFKNGYQFTTKYKTVDYCHGYFIVSKMKGKLYGVIDIKGNEILPLEYDNIEFYNREEIENGSAEDILFKTDYEGDSIIINKDNEPVFGYMISTYLGKDSIYYVQREGEKTTYVNDIETDKENYIWSISIYDRECNGHKAEYEIGRFESEYNIVNCIPLTKEYYVISEEKGIHNYDISLCKGKDIIWKEYSSYPASVRVIDNKAIIRINNFSNQDIFYSIDNNGLWEQVDNYYYDETGIFKGEKPEGYHYTLGDATNPLYLYKSNDTYKLNDKDGVPLYENRYYGLEIIDYRYFFLINDNSEVYAIDFDGKLIAELDVFEIEENKSMPYFDGKGMYYDEVYAGDDALYIVRESDNGYDVYRYSAQNKN